MRKISMLTRADLVEAVGEEFRCADLSSKGRLLDEFAGLTGFHRKHAIRLLRVLHAHALHKPRLLSDNSPSYIAGELAEYVADKYIRHFRRAPMHPPTQGKIERWQETLKNRILFENYFLPGDLKAQI